MMMTREFWVQAFQKAVRTFAQTAIAAIGVGQTNLFSADIQNILALSVSAAVLSILMSVDRSSENHATGYSSLPAVAAVDPPHALAGPPAPPPVSVGCGDSLK